MRLACRLTVDLVLNRRLHKFAEHVAQYRPLIYPLAGDSLSPANLGTWSLCSVSRVELHQQTDRHCEYTNGNQQSSSRGPPKAFLIHSHESSSEISSHVSVWKWIMRYRFPKKFAEWSPSASSGKLTAILHVRDNVYHPSSTLHARKGLPSRSKARSSLS